MIADERVDVSEVISGKWMEAGSYNQLDETSTVAEVGS